MALVVIAGDIATTTAMAVAAAWPVDVSGPSADVVMIEADGRGGSVAAWSDCDIAPSISTMIATLHRRLGDGGSARWSDVEHLVRQAPSGLRFVPMPYRAGEARGVVAEAEHDLLPLVASTPGVVGVVDAGPVAADRRPVGALDADVVVVVHRQSAASARAASVRVERLAEAVADVGAPRWGLAVVGDRPFTPEEIGDHVAPGRPVWALADDVLAASTFAGRPGVSERRFARLPLPRSAARLAADLDRMVRPTAGRRPERALR